MDIQKFALNKISELMRDRGLNKKSLALKSGLPAPSVYKVFSGQRAVTLNFLERVAVGLECSLAEFLPPPHSLEFQFSKEEFQKVLQTVLVNLRTNSLFEGLTSTEQADLDKLVKQFGGWKFLLNYLREELEIRSEAQSDYNKLRDSITSDMSLREISSIKKKMIVANMISKVNMNERIDR